MVASAIFLSSLPLSQPKCALRAPPLSFFHSPIFITPPNPFSSICFTASRAKRLLLSQMTQRSTKLWCSPSPSNLPNSSERWLLEPVGDGDTRHIGFKVSLPNAFEIASNGVTVGRLPDKADIVLPVATVSGLHARLEKKEGNLLVTDLDSTNGTFVNEKRLRPGSGTNAPTGSLITFGDIHLAMFRVSKIEVQEVDRKEDEPAIKSENTMSADNSVAAS